MLDYIKKNTFLLVSTILLSQHVMAAQTVYKENVSKEYTFLENVHANEYYIMPQRRGTSDPVFNGSNVWNKHGTRAEQVTLGNMGLPKFNSIGAYVDMTMKDPLVDTPFLGVSCAFGGTCPAGGYYVPAKTDRNGFYKAKTDSSGYYQGGAYALATLSPAIYSYFRDAKVGSSTTSVINWCATKLNYNINNSNGWGCFDYAINGNGTWSALTAEITLTHRKIGHIRLIDTHASSEIWVSSSGEPRLIDNSQYCEVAKFGTGPLNNGIVCKMVAYENRYVVAQDTDFFVNMKVDSTVTGVMDPSDVKYSGTKSGFKDHTEKSPFSNVIKSGEGGIYAFFTESFFKKLVARGKTFHDKEGVFTFVFSTTGTRYDANYYEFAASSKLNIIPAEYGVSIRPEVGSMGLLNGDIGSGQSIDFKYNVIVSGSRLADRITAKVKGINSTTKDGFNYCTFRPVDGSYNVLIPAFLRYIDKNNKQQSKRSGCNGSTGVSFQDAKWSEVPWDAAKSTTFYGTPLTLSFPMNESVSRYTDTGQSWEGVVYAEGDIKVTAEWIGVP